MFLVLLVFKQWDHPQTAQWSPPSPEEKPLQEVWSQDVMRRQQRPAVVSERNLRWECGRTQSSVRSPAGRFACNASDCENVSVWSQSCHLLRCAASPGEEFKNRHKPPDWKSQQTQPDISTHKHMWHVKEMHLCLITNLNSIVMVCIMGCRTLQERWITSHHRLLGEKKRKTDKQDFFNAWFVIHRLIYNVHDVCLCEALECWKYVIL